MPQGVIIDLKWMDWVEIIKYHLCLSLVRILLAFNREGLDEDLNCPSDIFRAYGNLKR